MGEKITEYSTETANAAQGGFTTVLGYFLNNEAYGEVFRRELEYAVARAHVDFGFHFSTANELHIKELGEYVRDYGVTSFKYFMNFKGEEGRYLGLDGTDDGFFYDLLKESVARRAADHRLPHREHRDREPRAPQDPGRGRQHAQGLVRLASPRSPSPSRRCAPCISPRSSARASTSRTSPRARRST